MFSAEVKALQIPPELGQFEVLEFTAKIPAASGILIKIKAWSLPCPKIYGHKYLESKRDLLEDKRDNLVYAHESLSPVYVGFKGAAGLTVCFIVSDQHCYPPRSICSRLSIDGLYSQFKRNPFKWILLLMEQSKNPASALAMQIGLKDYPWNSSGIKL